MLRRFLDEFCLLIPWLYFYAIPVGYGLVLFVFNSQDVFIVVYVLKACHTVNDMTGF